MSHEAPPSKPEVLYNPTRYELTQSAMATFCADIARRYALPEASYAALYHWSVTDPNAYWKELTAAGQIRYHGTLTEAMQGRRFFETEWFPGVGFNYAENMLAGGEKNAVALISVTEDGTERHLTFAELHTAVRKVAGKLRSLGLEPGDRIAGIVPNCDYAVIFALAAGSQGIVWSSASPDMGKESLLDRFSQITPKLLLSVDAYMYNGKPYPVAEKSRGVCLSLPSVEHHIVCRFGAQADDEDSDEMLTLSKIMALPEPENEPFVSLPFNNPLYILFSSGTTGMPKCITHSHGGVLFQHTSEMLLHCDVKPNDRMLFFSTCGWMMWNWMISALGRGASVIAFDGSPGFGHAHYLWELADRFGATHIGMGAKYVSVCSQAGNRRDFALKALRTVFTTGSPLTDDLFAYLVDYTKGAVRISSISGGTDIIACFVGGCPLLPVHQGQIQCRMLGMDVRAFNENGEEVWDEKGELVCLTPFPSAPACFHNDPDNRRYRQAYFEVFPEVWAHGDLITLWSATGGVTIFGRSDTTLNPGGVRIGSAEIYRHVEALPEIVDSIAIGVPTNDDETVVLFVVPASGYAFNSDTVQLINRTLKTRATPRHVPSKVFAVKDIPRTFNGKKMEKALKNMFAGKTNDNLSAMENPESLTEFETIYRQHYS